ncbi:MAG: hypothetical protein QOI17_1839 [Gaiellales bacterium]|nr:hypothetical protein [Gaiellales bacterium]
MVALEHEIAHESEIARRVPEVIDAISQRREPIEQLARELEGQWVAQGPLVSLWQRAVELSQLADGAGADPADYQAEIDRARQQVEVARLQTRDVLDRLCTQREGLVDAILAAPYPLPTPPPVRDDGRPEAGRRDALALLELIDEATSVSQEQRQRAEQRLAEAGSELAELGDAAELAERIAALERLLPDTVEMPRSAPPSSGLRLQRAGVRVTGAAAT